MVQVLQVPDDVDHEQKELWAALEALGKPNLLEIKLRVAYLPAEGATPQPHSPFAQSPGISQSFGQLKSEEPPTYDKDKTSNQSLSPSLENSRQTSGDKSLIDLSSGSSSAKVSASSVPLSQYNELLETLNASKRQVEKLNKAVEDLKREQIETKNELRQRKVVSSEATAPAAPSTSAPSKDTPSHAATSNAASSSSSTDSSALLHQILQSDGVNPQVVVVVAVVSFLMGVMLF